jgi:hypothetical protein
MEMWLQVVMRVRVCFVSFKLWAFPTGRIASTSVGLPDACEIFLTQSGLFSPTVFSATAAARFVQQCVLILWPLLLRSYVEWQWRGRVKYFERGF